MRHSKAEYEKRCAEAVRLRREKPAPSAMSFFSKAHKLRAATVIPNILAFARKYDLKLTDQECEGGPDCHGPGKQRPTYPELANKEPTWLRHPRDILYQAHLTELTKDAPKLLALKTLIDRLGDDIYGRPERLLIFTSSPVVSLIVTLVWFSFSYPSI